MATPSPAFSTWKARPPRSTTGIRKLLLGPCVFPLVAPTTGGTLLTLGDPFLAAAIPYFQYVLNYYLGSAFAAAMSGQVLAASNGACLQTMAVDPAPYLDKIVPRLPLLAVYATGGGTAGLTIRRTQITTRYNLAWILPPLTFDQAERIAPILTAALKVLSLATDEGGLDHYNAGARAWDAMPGQVKVHLGREFKIEYLGLADASTRMALPALTASLDVQQMDRFDESTALPFWGLTVEARVADQGDGELADLINASVNIE